MKLLPKDAKGFEKFVYYLVETLVPAGILFMLLSALQVFHNDYSEACKAASGWWKILGFVLLILSGVQFYALKEDKIVVTRGSIIVIGILLALSFLSFAGFYS